MHEIAHVVCKHKPMRLLPVGGPSIMLRDYDAAAEEETAWLGACLQLPREALCSAVRRRMTEPASAEHFLASVEQVRYQMQITGIMRQFAGRIAHR
jgi:IrrE N-terminal-like domain